MKRRKPYLLDKEATAAAGFLDERSYVKRTKDGELRYYRFGEDMRQLRLETFARSKGYCEMPIPGGPGARCNRNIAWETMELDHNPSLANDGDDSLEGVRAICRGCHQIRHNRTTKWTRKAVTR